MHELKGECIIALLRYLYSARFFQENLSGGLKCCTVCYIRAYYYYKCISELCKNCTGQIIEGGGQGIGLLNYCQPVWAEP